MNHLPTPPPSIIFSSQMEIAKKNCCLRTCHDQNQRNQENKSKHVVDLKCNEKLAK